MLDAYDKRNGEEHAAIATASQGAGGGVAPTSDMPTRRAFLGAVAKAGAAAGLLHFILLGKAGVVWASGGGAADCANEISDLCTPQWGGESDKCTATNPDLCSAVTADRCDEVSVDQCAADGSEPTDVCTNTIHDYCPQFQEPNDKCGDNTFGGDACGPPYTEAAGDTCRPQYPFYDFDEK